MSWAKSVLPAFTGGSSGKFRIAPNQVQIDTIDFRPQAPAKSALSRTPLALNRTAVRANRKPAGEGFVYEGNDCRGFSGRLDVYSDWTYAPHQSSGMSCLGAFSPAAALGLECDWSGRE